MHGRYFFHVGHKQVVLVRKTISAPWSEETARAKVRCPALTGIVRAHERTVRFSETSRRGVNGLTTCCSLILTDEKHLRVQPDKPPLVRELRLSRGLVILWLKLYLGLPQLHARTQGPPRPVPSGFLTRGFSDPVGVT